jgi:hypothetical protein
MLNGRLCTSERTFLHESAGRRDLAWGAEESSDPNRTLHRASWIRRLSRLSRAPMQKWFAFRDVRALCAYWRGKADSRFGNVANRCGKDLPHGSQVMSVLCRLRKEAFRRIGLHSGCCAMFVARECLRQS